MSNTKIILIPLDERPVNTRYPEMLAAIAGAELRLPPPEIRGLQRTPADVEKLIHWLRQSSTDADVCIASCEYLGYGNLINARISDDSTADVITRLAVLAEVGAQIPVHAFSLITRVSNADDCVEEPLYWLQWGTKFYRFARLYHRNEAGDLTETERADLSTLQAELPHELVVDWLTRRLRNHAVKGSVAQEPWQFGPQALAIIRHYVRLRYKLLPYLYQLWVAQARDGSAVMRPLFHDFDNADGLDLDRIDDQFLVGPALMQAPLVHQGQQQRTVALPGTGRWLDAGSGRFVAAGRSVQARSDAASTPLYAREGQLLPMQPGERTTPSNDLADIELHVILGRGCTDAARLDYTFDDGLSDAHERGERGVVRFHATRVGDEIVLRVETLQAWKPLRVSVVGYDAAASVKLVLASGVQAQALVGDSWTFSGQPLAIGRGSIFAV